MNNKHNWNNALFLLEQVIKLSSDLDKYTMIHQSPEINMVFVEVLASKSGTVTERDVANLLAQHNIPHHIRQYAPFGIQITQLTERTPPLYDAYHQITNKHCQAILKNTGHKSDTIRSLHQFMKSRSQTDTFNVVNAQYQQTLYRLACHLSDMLHPSVTQDPLATKQPQEDIKRYPQKLNNPICPKASEEDSLIFDTQCQ